MKITHKLISSAQSFAINTANITTNCHAVLIDNTGSDDVRIYFNNEATYFLLKAGTALPIKSDNLGETIQDIIKIEFVSTIDPLINILLQTKKIIN